MNFTHPTIAVVILNYNGEKLLSQFLPSVIRHSQNAEVIVADNASTDHSIDFLEKEFPQVRIIRLDKNYGFCGGYNRALQQVHADYFVLLNSDVEVTEGWLDPVINLLEKDKSIGAAQPKVLSFIQRNRFEYAGAAGGFIDALGYPFCRGRIFNHIETDSGQYDGTREIFWATGACLIIRSELYFHFEGFDEDFFAHMEEIDLCWKLNRAGHKIYFCGDSPVYHLGAGTLGYSNPRKTFYNFRNGLFLIYKHLSSKELFWKLPLRIILDWIAAIMFLLKGEPGNWLAVWKAHYHFFRNLKHMHTRRSSLHRRYPVYSRACIHPSLIIIDYYLKGKRSFQKRKLHDTPL